MTSITQKFMRLVLAAVVAGAAVGCGGSTSKGPVATVATTGTTTTRASNESSTASPSVATGKQLCKTQSFATLCMTIDVSGTTSLKGTGDFVVAASDCASFARNDKSRTPGRLQFAPTLDTVGAAPSGPASFTMGAFVENYTGPGSYGLDKLSSPGGEWQVVVSDATFTEVAGSTGSFVVKADGSGSFTFTGFENETAGQLSGLIAWTCAD
jgi:hypothetical protein